MANTIPYKNTLLSVGDTIAVDYKIKEGEKFRIQQFTGVLIKVRGASEQTRMITVRKVSKSGIGVERIIPLSSPFINSISVIKQSNNTRAKIYYVRNLSDKKLRRKLYHNVSQTDRTLKQQAAPAASEQSAEATKPAESAKSAETTAPEANQE
ncbi:MAG: 50S ribosomal protein L19 [Patescibacteria group bacterium]|nr:50S ribosomal protein L19 [Patescibacteria group bacterium]